MASLVPFAFMLRLLVACLGAALLSSCATSSSSPARHSHVGRVDFGVVTNGADLAERARQAGERFYPQVCALLRDGETKFPRRFDIYLKARLKTGNLAEARLTQVWFNGKYLDQIERELGGLENVLVHELAHVAQRYYWPILGKWLIFNPEPPSHWIEGIADYVCFKLGQTNAWHCAECGPAYPHYRNGYACAGAFLLFVEQTYNPQIVARLNTVLREGRYKDTFFFEATGKDLGALWAEFRQTPGYTPSAARMLAFQQELGFAEGKAPKDIEKRIEKYLQDHTDARTRKLMACAQIAGLQTNELQARLTLIQYFTQPGGSAEAFVVGLQEKQGLPGIAKGEHGILNGFLHHRDLTVKFPAMRLFTASKRGNDSTYHYGVSRASQEAEWQIDRAWRTNPDGTLAEEYAVR